MIRTTQYRSKLVPDKLLSRIPLLGVTKIVILSLLLSSCSPSSPVASTEATETQPAVTEILETQTPTPEPTPTVTPDPTATITPEPTRQLLSLEAGPEEMVNKVNELISNGFDVTWEEREDGNLDLYLPSQVENEAEENDERVLLATMEVESGSLRITTAKNEPYSFSPDQMELEDGRLLISDERWGNLINGDLILEFRNNGWEADRLLYLAAGENPRRLTSSDYDRLPDDANGERPITGVSNLELSNSTRIFRAILIDESTVGFYDPNGMLHTYNLDLIGFSTVGGTGNMSVCQPIEGGAIGCQIYTREEVEEILSDWNDQLLHRRITINVPVLSYEPHYRFVSELIQACESGVDYPDISEGSIPVAEFKVNVIP